MALQDDIIDVDQLTRALEREEKRIKALGIAYTNFSSSLKISANSVVDIITVLERTDAAGRKVIDTFNNGKLVSQQVVNGLKEQAAATQAVVSAMNDQIQFAKQLQQIVENKRAKELKEEAAARQALLDKMNMQLQYEKQIQQTRNDKKIQDINAEVAARQAVIAALNDQVQYGKQVQQIRDDAKVAALNAQQAAVARQIAQQQKAYELEYQIAKLKEGRIAAADKAELDRQRQKIAGLNALVQLSRQMANTGSVGVKSIGKDVAVLNSGVEQLTLSWKSFERIILARVITQVFHRFIASISQSVRESADLIRNLGEVQTIAGPLERTTAGLDRLAEASFRFSSQYGFKITDSIEAFYDNLSNQIADSALELEFFNTQAAKLAKTTKSTLEQSSNTISAILNAYGQGFGEAERVAAQLFVTVDEGRLRLEEIANTFGRIAVPAAQLGISLAEVNAALSTITISGIPATEGMTLLRNVIFKLQRPTEAMKDLFKEWGVATGDIAIETFGFAEILRRLDKEAEKGSEEFGKLFGRIRAFRGGLSLTGEALKDYEENLVKLTNAQKRFDEAFSLVFENKGDIAQRELNKVKNAILQDFAFPVVEAFADISKQFNFIDDIIASTAKFGILAGLLGTTAAVLTLIGPLILSPIGITIGIVSALTVAYVTLAGTATRTYKKLSEKIAADEMKNLEVRIAAVNEEYDELLENATKGDKERLKNLAEINVSYNNDIKALERLVDLYNDIEDSEVAALEAILEGSDAKAALVRSFEDVNALSDKYNISLHEGNAALTERADKLNENIDQLKEQLDASKEFSSSFLQQGLDDRFERQLRGLNPAQQSQAQFNRAGDTFTRGIRLFNAGDVETARELFEQAYDLLTQSEAGAYDAGLLGNIQQHTAFFEQAFNKLVNTSLAIEAKHKDNTLKSLSRQEQAEKNINKALEDRKNLLDQLQAEREFDATASEKLEKIFKDENASIQQRLDAINEVKVRSGSILETEKEAYRLKLQQLEADKAALLLEDQIEAKKVLNAQKRQTRSAEEQALSNLRGSLGTFGDIPVTSIKSPKIPFGTTRSGLGFEEAKNLFDTYNLLSENLDSLIKTIQSNDTGNEALINALIKTSQIALAGEKYAIAIDNIDLVEIFQEKEAAIYAYLANRLTTEGEITAQDINQQNIITEQEKANKAYEDTINRKEENNIATTNLANTEANTIPIINARTEAINRNTEAIARNRSAAYLAGQAFLNERATREPRGVYRAAGGPIGSDTINAWLTPGEFVINKAATSRNFALLTALNSGSRSRSNYYASGGVVNNFSNTFNTGASSNMRVNVRRSAAELRRQIGRGTTTLNPKTRIPF